MKKPYSKPHVETIGDGSPEFRILTAKAGELLKRGIDPADLKEDLKLYAAKEGIPYSGARIQTAIEIARLKAAMG